MECTLRPLASIAGDDRLTPQCIDCMHPKGKRNVPCGAMSLIWLTLGQLHPCTSLFRSWRRYWHTPDKKAYRLPYLEPATVPGAFSSKVRTKKALILNPYCSSMRHEKERHNFLHLSFLRRRAYSTRRHLQHCGTREVADRTRWSLQTFAKV